MNQKQAKELVRSRLSDKRYEHTLNVKKMAVRLAKRYGVDEDKAALAALLHDSAKEISTDEMLPAVAQGAIGIERRRDDPRTGPLLAAINDADTLPYIAQFSAGELTLTAKCTGLRGNTLTCAFSFISSAGLETVITSSSTSSSRRSTSG